MLYFGITQVQLDNDGKLESFNPLGYASTSLQALPRMRE
jgi:hypothetical protein